MSQIPNVTFSNGEFGIRAISCKNGGKTGADICRRRDFFVSLHCHSEEWLSTTKRRSNRRAKTADSGPENGGIAKQKLRFHFARE